MCLFIIIVTLLASSAVLGQQVSANASAVVTSGEASAMAMGRASSSSSAAEVSDCPCNDEPPKADSGKTQFSCAEQKEFGKCDVDFMVGFCECECGRCPALQPLEESSPEQEDVIIPAVSLPPIPKPEPTPKPKATPSPTPTPTPAPTSSCPSGSVPIIGSSECESIRCAKNRQECGAGCGGLAEIKFDCKDVTDGNSSAFGSSCACAGQK